MIRIIGIGNRMHGDDGIGPCLAYALRKCSARVEGVNIIPLDLPNHGDIALLEEPDIIVFVDASPERGVRVYRLEPSRLSSLEMVRLAQAGSGHAISPITLVALASAAGLIEGKEVYLLTIGPLEPGFGSGLSPKAVELGVEAVRRLVGLLSGKGVDVRADEGCIHSVLSGACSDPLTPLDEIS